MNSLVLNQGAAVQVQDVTGYFERYIRWIDRGEKTVRTYLNNLKQFARWMQDEGITHPTRDDIIAYRDYLTAKGCRPSTVKGYLQTVRSFFKWMASEGLYLDIASNIHAPKVSQDTRRKEALDAAAVVSIEESIQERAAAKVSSAEQERKDTAGRIQRADEQGKRLFAIYMLATTAGLRTIELSRLNCEDFVRRGEKSYLYIHGKGHDEADTKKYIAPEVADAIADYLQAREVKPTAGGPLFVATGNRNKGGRIATTTISTMLKKAMQEAGYDDARLTAHSCRHSAGTLMMQASDKNIYRTQKYMRHASPKTTEIYLHLSEEEQDASDAEMLYNYIHGR